MGPPCMDCKDSAVVPSARWGASGTQRRHPSGGRLRSVGHVGAPHAAPLPTRLLQLLSSTTVHLVKPSPPQQAPTWFATRMSAPGQRIAAHTPHSSLSASPRLNPEQVTRRGTVPPASERKAFSRSAWSLEGEMASDSNWFKKPAWTCTSPVSCGRGCNHM